MAVKHSWRILALRATARASGANLVSRLLLISECIYVCACVCETTKLALKCEMWPVVASSHQAKAAITDRIQCGKRNNELLLLLLLLFLLLRLFCVVVVVVSVIVVAAAVAVAVVVVVAVVFVVVVVVVIFVSCVYNFALIFVAAAKS